MKPQAHNPFENALAQLRRVEGLGGVKASTIERMSHPEREIGVSIPVAMDDGSTKLFEGYRVQHSSLRGPYKGGIRFHPKADMSEVNALALWMTLKCAVAGIPMGGGKGGITVDPKTLSEGELEKLSRGWVRALWRNLGPHVDVPAPDVHTNGTIMSWMLDEYQTLSGDKSMAAFTGKPLDKGGSAGREKATGQGGFYVFDALKEKFGMGATPAGGGVNVAIQGMGNVGGHAAEIFHEHGYRIVAMSDSKGGVYNEEGLDPENVEAYKKEHGSLEGYTNTSANSGATAISNSELLTLPVDVLVPAALENQITEENANAIEAKLVLELANGPTTPEADDILHGRGVPVIPDILANSGGVIVSTFEWQQNLKGEVWSAEDVDVKLKEILAREALHVYNEAQRLTTDLRRGAFAVALQRIETALER